MNTPTVRVTDPECPEGLTWVGSGWDFANLRAVNSSWLGYISFLPEIEAFKWNKYDTVVVTHGEEFKISRIDLEAEFEAKRRALFVMWGLINDVVKDSGKS